MVNLLRRKFLKSSALLVAGLTIVSNKVLGSSFGHASLSDKLNIAGIGLGVIGDGKQMD